MQNKSSSKSIIIIIAVLVLAGLAYFYFSGDPEDTTSLLATDSIASSEATAQATKIIMLLNQTSELKIDPAFFKSAAYKSLVDHTVDVVEQPVGKYNPFVRGASSPVATSSQR